MCPREHKTWSNILLWSLCSKDGRECKKYQRHIATHDSHTDHPLLKLHQGMSTSSLGQRNKLTLWWITANVSKLIKARKSIEQCWHFERGIGQHVIQWFEFYTSLCINAQRCQKLGLKLPHVSVSPWQECLAIPSTRPISINYSLCFHQLLVSQRKKIQNLAKQWYELHTSVLFTSSNSVIIDMID